MPMKPRDILGSVVFYVILIGVLLIIVRLGSQYGWEKVPQSFTRMEPRLGRGDHVFVNKWACRPEQLEYEDIIMYRRPLWKRATWWR